MSLGSLENWTGGWNTLYITRGDARKQYGISYTTQQLGNLKLNTIYTASSEFRENNESYVQKLYSSGNFLYYDNTVSTQNGGLMPASAYLNLGGSVTTSAPYPWRHIFGRWIHAYDQFGCDNKTIGSYDSKDDLALIKGLKSERATNLKYLKNHVSGKEEVNEVEEDIIDFSELDFLHLDDNSLSINKLIGFLYGCTKALAKKQDEHDAVLLKLLNEIDSLHAEIALLKNA